MRLLKDRYMTNTMMDMTFFGDGKKNPTNWKRGSIIGRGTFGAVYHVTMTTTEGVKELAVKEIKICEVYKQKRHEEIVNREIATLKQVSHERIIKFHGVCFTDLKFHIFIEYSPLGTLSKFIDDKQVIDEIKARLFSKQLLEGVAYLHGIGLFHRDIKCDNVLVFDEDSIKLADFGLAKVFAEITQTNTKEIGTIRFMAPEMIKSEKYNKQVDIWSVGCVAFNMLTGQVPFHELEAQQVMFCVGHENQSPVTNILPELPDCSKAFFEKTFQVDTKQRPSAESLLTDRFITGIYYSKHDLQWKEKRLNLLFVATCEYSTRKYGINYTSENIFKTSNRSSSSESSVLKGSTEFEDYIINVVELPDIDVDVTRDDSLEKFQNIMKEGFKYCDDGFSALIFVPSYTNRLTKQEIEMLNLLRTTLGSDVVKNNLICLFAYRDMLESQMQLNNDYAFQSKQTESPYQDLLAECNHRCVTFSNESSDKSVDLNGMKRLISLATQTKTYTRDDYIAAIGQEHENLNSLKRVAKMKSILNEMEVQEEKIEFERETHSINGIFSEKPYKFRPGEPIRPRLNFLLIGTCGNGKSASGNSIIGENVFGNSAGSSKIKSLVQKGSTQFNDYTINVVDLPGTEVDVKRDENLETFQTYLRKGFKYCDEGFSALIFVLNYNNRFTKQETEMLKFMRTTLGSDVVKNSVICLFTHGDMFESDKDELKLDFDSWCRQQEGQIQDLLSESNHRCVLFNNKSSDKSTRENQIEKLISLTKQTKKYTQYDYIAATKGREKQKPENLSAKILDETQEFLKKLRFKMTDSERIKDTSKRVTELKKILKQLKEREDEILHMKIEFKRANNPINLIFALKSEIESKIKLLKQPKDGFKRGGPFRVSAPHVRQSRSLAKNDGDQDVEETEGTFVRGEPKRLSLPNRKRNSKPRQTASNANSKSKKNCQIL
ncbi:Mitogen-activated protein kinase kinase kinase 1 [Bulinus truncatus]|nr:Mitogen-activated protein kinase kinase kinase 1 [Bulinus truncatus]